MKRLSPLRKGDAGFTLAELLVASMLLSIVMAAVYTAFSSSVRLWRLGEANIQTYQDARTSLSIMTRELQNIIPGAAHLAEGTNDEFQFYAVAAPMDVDEDSEPRVLFIQYRTKKDTDGEGKILLREERVVKSPLPSAPPGEGEIEATIIKMGNEKDFDLAAGVKDFEIRYIWRPPDEDVSPIPGDAAPEPVEFVVLEEHSKGSGIPQGLRIELTLLDANAESGESTFTTYVVFRGATSELDREFLDTKKAAIQ